MHEVDYSGGTCGAISPQMPDFLIVGAPKCGTTSLHAWLSRHQRLHMPEKEPGFFSQDILPLGKILPGYLDLFSGAGHGQLIGEATPKYLYSRLGLRQIQRFNPKAKIIVALRPPVDLIVSFHGQMLREGEESEASFERAWRLTERRLAGHSVPGSCRSVQLLNYPFWGEIGSRLQDVYSIFPREQVLVVLLEDMDRCPRSVYLQVLEHLGIEDDGFNNFERLNEGSHVRWLWLHRAVLRGRTWLSPILTRLTEKREGKGTGFLRFLNRRNQVASKMHIEIDASFRSELSVLFKPQVELVEQLTGRSLEHWKQH